MTAAAPARGSLTRRALAAAVTALAVAFVMLGMESAHALWQDRSSTDAGTVSTGTAELTAQWSEDDDPSTWQNLLPGDKAPRTIAVTNEGDVPLALHAAVPTAPAGIELRMTDGSETRSPGPALSTALQPLTESGAPLVVEPGQTVCIHAQLTATPGLVPGQQDALSIELEGRQVA